MLPAFVATDAEELVVDDSTLGGCRWCTLCILAPGATPYILANSSVEALCKRKGLISLIELLDTNDVTMRREIHPKGQIGSGRLKPYRIF